MIQYQKTNNTLDLYHTEVPEVFRGQGIAALLAKVCFSCFLLQMSHSQTNKCFVLLQGAFEYVLKNNLKMKLSCDYLQKYYKNNSTPELEKTLA